ncbi:hypothetical protein F3Y22_tig00110457pilonHSYRG00029 [Hibiscus syriacus]|uniref:Uncharacterized protein n=1 Tax=Hibiscus syriacus TaxID=106335 RepID=A0A6A3ALT6_HIBSY|nr:hypothetical protein F3Y22_tig00110457pilonHSYRG00029 [Hibiscus syriacus]
MVQMIIVAINTVQRYNDNTQLTTISKLLLRNSDSIFIHDQTLSPSHQRFYSSSAAPSTFPSSDSVLKLGFLANKFDAFRPLGFKASDAIQLARHYGQCYWELSKARLSMLVVVTSGTGYVLGSGDAVNLPGLCCTCAGTMMVAASSNLLNQDSVLFYLYLAMALESSSCLCIFWLTLLFSMTSKTIDLKSPSTLLCSVIFFCCAMWCIIVLLGDEELDQKEATKEESREAENCLDILKWYLDMLPTTFGNLLWFTDDEMLELRGIIMYRATELRKKDLISVYKDKVKGLVKKLLALDGVSESEVCFEDFLWYGSPQNELFLNLSQNGVGGDNEVD